MPATAAAIITTEPPVPPPSIFGKLSGLCKDYVQKPIARKQLEIGLSTLFKAAKAHEENGLAAGSPEYQELLRQSETLLSRFCHNYQIPKYELEVQLASLKVLRDLAHPKPAKPSAGALKWIFLGLLLPVLLGLAHHVYRSFA